METYDQKKVDALNTKKYEAVPIVDYLYETSGGKKPTEPAPPVPQPEQPTVATPTSSGTEAIPIEQQLLPSERPSTKVIRGQEMSTGDDVHWMSGGTWDGKIQDIVEKPSGNHDVTVKATNGEIHTLKDAEHYGINLGRSQHITEANKPSYEGWEKDYPDLAAPVPEAEAPTTAEPLPQTEVVPPPVETPHLTTESAEVAPEGGVSAARLEERPINAPPPGEGVGWEETRAFGNEWLDKGGNVNKVIADFNRTGKLDEWDVGKGAAYLERLQSVTNRARDALRANPTDPILQQNYGVAKAAEQRFTDAYRPMATTASNTLKGFQGKTPLTEEMADSFSGLERKFGEIQGREMTPEEVVKADRLTKQTAKAKGEYRAVNDEFYRQADTEFGRIRTTRKGPPTLEDIGKIFGEKLKEVCDI